VTLALGVKEGDSNSSVELDSTYQAKEILTNKG
jgi:hypothetical protein